MIKKFQQFIKESFCPDLLAEIEQRFIVLDDNDIEYTINKYIDITNNFNTYQVGYIIRTNNYVNYDKISSVIKYFEKFYKVFASKKSITITEEKVLTKDEVLNMTLNETQIKQVEEFSQDIFNRMIKKDNVWYIKDELIFDQDQKNKIIWCKYNRWWKFFVGQIGLEYQQIQAISKCLFEEHLNRNVFTPLATHGTHSQLLEEHLNRKVFTPEGSL
jgi:hypothetical protein